MHPKSSLLPTVLLWSLVAVGCARHSALFYCYDGGQIYVGDPTQKIWNGLGGVQLRFEIPQNADPTTWHPPRDLVIQQLAAVDQQARVRWQLPSSYSRIDYCTNFVSLQEYQRRAPERK